MEKTLFLILALRPKMSSADPLQPQTGHISSYLYISLSFSTSAFPPDRDHHVHIDPHGSGLHTSKAIA